jgi:prepilin-type N-terminal cleavage/methylation domain-containing protein
MRTVPRSNRQGATLVELIVALFIGSILLVLITRFFGSQNKTYLAQLDAVELRGGLRAAMDLVQREVRNAGFDPTGIGFLPVEFDTSRLIVRNDSDGDGDLLGPDEQIAYFLDDRTHCLMRGPAGVGGSAPQVVLDEVDTFEFIPLDGSGTRIVDPVNSAQIREVMIRLVANTTSRNGAVASQGGMQYNGLVVTVIPANLNLP